MTWFLITFILIVSKLAGNPNTCSDNVFQQNYANQNMCLLLHSIPHELQGLPYAIYPNDTTYNTLRFNNNKLTNLFPHAIFIPRNEEEISYVFQFLRQYKLPFSIRSGGFGYEPASLSSEYIIDLKELNSIQPDAKKQKVFIGSGASVGEVIQTLGALDFAIPTSDCPFNGIGGSALGGGIGLLSRAYGLTCDSILSIRLLTADGDILDISKKHHPDLFWALRGAGQGSFGIVLGMSFKMVPIKTANFLELSWDWNPKAASRILQNWQSWSTNQTEAITSHLRFSCVEGKLKVTLQALKVGSEPFNEWKGFFESLQPEIKTYTGRYLDTAYYWVTNHFNPFYKAKSAFLMDPLTSQGIETLIASLNTLGKREKSYRFYVTLTALGGNINKGNTAYFPRNAVALYQSMVSWPTPEEESPALKKLKELHGELTPFLSGYAYTNITDYDLGKTYLEAYYGGHVDQLIQIKNQYDPLNIFHWKQSIPLENYTGKSR